eukprot:TRINITY_DN4539_c0_g1_i1.p1 TRINITY_DN4539_c0_g1~~TRINITY_DN4539_c0_g1_i1.p1  ORF type:complete len:708 (-),score=162.30 TRINITY_DN4539_c0_g1_i1:273-2396(-)
MSNIQSSLLADYLSSWKVYHTGAIYLNRIFNYLNNNWIRSAQTKAKSQVTGLTGHAETPKIEKIIDLALITWKNNLFDRLKGRLNSELMDYVRRERDGEGMQQHDIPGVINSLVVLGSMKPTKPLKIYQNDFECHYLSEMKNYYAIEATNYISQNGVAWFMSKAEVRLKEEEVLAKKYLHEDSFKKVVDGMNEVLIVKLKDVIQVECDQMLREERLEDLHRMYTLFLRIPGGIDYMCGVLEQHIVYWGLDVLKSAREGGELLPKVNTRVPGAQKNESSEIYVQKLLSIYGKFKRVVDVAFNSNPHFVSSLDKGCRTVVNENCVAKGTIKSPELLAKYADSLLRKGGEHLDETELESRLSDCVLIFKYLSDRDVFRRFYSTLLTKRLLSCNSVSDDAEKTMISKLKEACGFEYVTKLQRMFTDIQISNTVSEKFRESCSGLGDLPKIESSFFILTNGSWPLPNRRTTFNLPPDLVPLRQSFENFYVSNYSGRRMTWMYNFSQSDVRMMFTKKKYEFCCTNYQLAVLLLFNDAPKWRASEIKEQTLLDNVELPRVLASLLEYKMIKKVESSSGDDRDGCDYHGGDSGDGDGDGAVGFNPSHVYQLNDDFSHKRIRFKITSSTSIETHAENETTKKAIFADRKFYLQAVIVRIMKTRQRMTFQELIQEVISQSTSRFQPNIRLIKECVEVLVEKEYMARSDFGDTYEYRA